MSNVLFHGMQEQRPAKAGGVLHKHLFENGFTAVVRLDSRSVYKCYVTKRTAPAMLEVVHNTAVESDVSFGALFLVNLWLADVAAMTEDGQRPSVPAATEEVPWWDR